MRKWLSLGITCSNDSDNCFRHNFPQTIFLTRADHRGAGGEQVDRKRAVTSVTQIKPLFLWHHHNGWVTPDIIDNIMLRHWSLLVIICIILVVFESQVLEMDSFCLAWWHVHMWLSLSISDLIIIMRVIIITWSLSWWDSCQCVAHVKSKSAKSIIREMWWKQHFQIPWLDIKLTEFDWSLANELSRNQGISCNKYFLSIVAMLGLLEVSSQITPEITQVIRLCQIVSF